MGEEFIVDCSRADREESVFQKTVKGIEELKKAVEECIEKNGAHFVTIARVVTCKPAKEKAKDVEKAP